MGGRSVGGSEWEEGVRAGGWSVGGSESGRRE